jgi:hypothetical protein
MGPTAPVLWFTAHPAEKGMTYREHLYRAWYMAWHMGCGSASLVVHGLFPAWYSATGSQTIQRLYREMRREEERVKEENVEKLV